MSLVGEENHFRYMTASKIHPILVDPIFGLLKRQYDIQEYRRDLEKQGNFTYRLGIGRNSIVSRLHKSIKI